MPDDIRWMWLLQNIAWLSVLPPIFLSGLRWVVRYCLINVLTNFFVSTYG